VAAREAARKDSFHLRGHDPFPSRIAGIGNRDARDTAQENEIFAASIGGSRCCRTFVARRKLLGLDGSGLFRMRGAGPHSGREYE